MIIKLPLSFFIWNIHPLKGQEDVKEECNTHTDKKIIPFSLLNAGTVLGMSWQK